MCKCTCTCIIRVWTFPCNHTCSIIHKSFTVFEKLESTKHHLYQCFFLQRYRTVYVTHFIKSLLQHSLFSWSTLKPSIGFYKINSDLHFLVLLHYLLDSCKWQLLNFKIILKRKRRPVNLIKTVRAEFKMYVNGRGHMKGPEFLNNSIH